MPELKDPGIEKIFRNPQYFQLSVTGLIKIREMIYWVMIEPESYRAG